MYHVTTLDLMKKIEMIISLGGQNTSAQTENSRLTINVVRINIQQSRQKYHKEQMSRNSHPGHQTFIQYIVFIVVDDIKTHSESHNEHDRGVG